MTPTDADRARAVAALDAACVSATPFRVDALAREYAAVCAESAGEIARRMA